MKEVLVVADQLVSLEEIIEVEDLAYVPHELETILDFCEHHVRNLIIIESKIKWKDGVAEDATWESLARVSRLS